MKILICSDGSAQADRAIRFITDVAAASQAEVTLLGIVEAQGDKSALLEALSRAQQVLEQKKVRAELITKSGQALEEITKRTEETPYDLAVIGAVHKDANRLFWMSVKAYQIIKRIKPPVLVVMGQDRSLKRILVCTEGKNHLRHALPLVSQMAQLTSAEITLFHVLPQPPAFYSSFYKQALDSDSLLNSFSELGRNLRLQKETFEQRGLATQVSLRQGLVSREILHEMRRGNYDLVVAGSSLSSGPVSSYVLGDITREIVNRADCPVLVARPIHPLHFVDQLKRLLRARHFLRRHQSEGTVAARGYLPG